MRLKFTGIAYLFDFPPKVGEGGKWTSTVTNSNRMLKVEAETKPECIYNVCSGLVGAPPSYTNFTKWFSYPVNHAEVAAMTANLEHILELLPLQNHLDRQMYTNRVEVALEVHISINQDIPLKIVRVVLAYFATDAFISFLTLSNDHARDVFTMHLISEITPIHNS